MWLVLHHFNHKMLGLKLRLKQNQLNLHTEFPMNERGRLGFLYDKKNRKWKIRKRVTWNFSMNRHINYICQCVGMTIRDLIRPYMYNKRDSVKNDFECIPSKSNTLISQHHYSGKYVYPTGRSKMQAHPSQKK